MKTAIKTRFRAGGLKGSGTIKNVTSEGLFVSTGSIPAEGEAVQLLLPVPGERPLALSGLVWWTTPLRSPRPGFGLRLLDASDCLDRLVKRLG